MIAELLSRLIIVAFGNLYPAYASYKAVRTRDVREYVKWMMYWIVFGLFTAAEMFTDVLLSFWFPFYYEIKVALVFWLLSPATNGSSFLYRHFVHPALQKREAEIDEMILKTKERGYNTVQNLVTKSVSYASTVILQTAMKSGGGLMEQLIKRSYSLTDLPQKPASMIQDAPDGSVRPTRPAVRGRKVVGSTANLNMRFPEVDVDIRSPPAHHDIIGDIRSTEDISSGYSSTDQLFTEGVLTRSSSLSSARARGRGGRTTQPKSRAPLSEDTEESEDEFQSAMPSQYVSPGYQTPFQNHLNPSMAQSVQSERPKSVDVAMVYSCEPMVAPLVSRGQMAADDMLSPDSVSRSSLSDVSDSGLTSDSERKGRYRKRQAPPPPEQSPIQTPPVQPSVPPTPFKLNFPDVFTD